MKVNVHLFLDSPLDVEDEIDPGELGLRELGEDRFGNPLTLNVIAPVKVKLRFQMIGQKVMVTGRASTVARMECVRTLQPMDVPIVAENIRLFYLHRDQAIQSAGEIEVRIEDEDIAYYNKDEIVIDEQLRDLLLLETPEYPVCDELSELEHSHAGEEPEAEETDEEPEWKRKLKNINLN